MDKIYNSIRLEKVSLNSMVKYASIKCINEPQKFTLSRTTKGNVRQGEQDFFRNIYFDISVRTQLNFFSGLPLK